MTAVGEAYLVGRGVEPDRPEAFKWFERAATNGDARGQVYVAEKYLSFSTNEAGQKLAFQWLQKAANQWYLQAQFLVALNCAAGIGTKKDIIESYKWAKLAASQGSPYGVGFMKGLENHNQITTNQIQEADERLLEFINTNLYQPPNQQPPDVIDLNSLMNSIKTNSASYSGH